VNISIAYNALGQNDKAEASLRRALQLDPTNAPAQLNLGMLLAEMGRCLMRSKPFAPLSRPTRGPLALLTIGRSGFQRSPPGSPYLVRPRR